MKPRLATAALLALLASAGCVDNWASVQPYAVCAPPEDTEVCAQAAECEMLLAGRPYMYTLVDGFPNALVVWIQFNNQLPDDADPSTGRVNGNDFYAHEMDLEFSGDGVATPVTVPVSFTVPAAGAFSPLLPIIPELQNTQFLATIPTGAAGTVLVDITVRGTFANGNDLEIGPYQVVVDVLNWDPIADPLLGNPLLYSCADAADVFVACPKLGQTASFDCVTP